MDEDGRVQQLTIDLPAASSAPSLRWGVMGPGWIADRFVHSLRLGSQTATAVASRDLGRATTFAETHDVGSAYGSYEELVNDPEVDAVYVATPHVSHLEHALLCIEAGTPALVEKPLGINAAQARTIHEAASAAGVLVVEACWNYFMPKFMLLRKLLDEGALGSVATVSVDHGEWFPDDHRVLRADLAGGPMLDLGSYDFAFATWVLGAPVDVVSVRTDHPLGVHGQLSTAMIHGGGTQSLLSTSVMGATPLAGFVSGSEGLVTFPSGFYRPGRFTLERQGVEPAEWVEEEIGHDGLHHQAAWFARDLADGRTSSSIRDLEASVVALDAMDTARRRTGIIFPGESAPGVLVDAEQQD